MRKDGPHHGIMILFFYYFLSHSFRIIHIDTLPISTHFTATMYALCMPRCLGKWGHRCTFDGHGLLRG